MKLVIEIEDAVLAKIEQQNVMKLRAELQNRTKPRSGCWQRNMLMLGKYVIESVKKL